MTDRCGAFQFFYYSLSYCCVQWTLSSTVITLLRKTELVVLIFLSLCDVFCFSLFALPLGVIDRLCSVVVALPGHLYYIHFQR